MTEQEESRLCSCPVESHSTLDSLPLPFFFMEKEINVSYLVIQINVSYLVILITIILVFCHM